MTKEKKVGLFVVAGLLVLALSVFLIGQNSRFWERKVNYTAVYDNVAGLRSGAPVSMGGVDVGIVTRVHYADDPKDPHIYVNLSIVKDQAERIRRRVLGPDGKKVQYEGTVASIVNKGLLGDKMLELSMADSRAPVLDPATPIRSEEPLDLSTYVAKVDALSAKADKVLGNLEGATEGLNDPQLADDLRGSVGALHNILNAVAHEDGAAHRLIYDKKEADHISHVMANLDSSTGQLSGLLADAHDVTRQVRQGPGMAHALVYDGEMSSNAAGSLAEVHKDLEHIRTGNGLAHALLYGDTDSQHLMTNVNAMSDDLRTIVGNLKNGKGTLGALLVDPSIYEDLKRIVGNVERNEVLRALVRYSLQQDDKQAGGQSPEPKVESSSP